jgi:hypothetical protein
MSKSLGNAIGINDAPGEMYGKLMSISDPLMWSYWTLLTDLRQSEIDRMQADVASGKLHPMTAKKQLAAEHYCRLPGRNGGGHRRPQLGEAVSAEGNSGRLGRGRRSRHCRDCATGRLASTDYGASGKKGQVGGRPIGASA